MTSENLQFDRIPVDKKMINPLKEYVLEIYPHIDLSYEPSAKKVFNQLCGYIHSRYSGMSLVEIFQIKYPKKIKKVHFSILKNRILDEISQSKGELKIELKDLHHKFSVEINKIPRKLLRVIGQALCQSSYTVRLTLADTNLADQDLRVLKKAIKSGKIHTLDLKNNALTDRGGERLHKYLKSKNCSISSILLEGNLFSNSVVSTIDQQVSEILNRKLEHNENF